MYKPILSLLFWVVFYTSAFAQNIPLLTKHAVIYEVNTRQFTKEGTFKAFAKHLPRLQKMGVNIIWLMPIQPIGTTNRKGTLGSYYSIANYTDINPEYGTLADFKAVVKQAHALNMKVMIDWVANHTSWDHPWVKAHPEYYALDSNGKKYSPFDWSDVAQINHKNKRQQEAMLSDMKYWVTNCDIDGFRCDMAHLMPLEFWKTARTKLDQVKPLIWLGETQDTNYFEAFDIIYGWEWLHKMEDYVKGTTIKGGLDSLMQNYYLDYQKGKYRLLFTTNHDENSWSGTEFDRLKNYTGIFTKACIQLPGIPLIYSGQEEPLKRRLQFFEKENINFSKYALQNNFKNLIKKRPNKFNKKYITNYLNQLPKN
jgi:alpha-amylase